MRKLRRLHFADVAGIILAVMFTLAGIIALANPVDIIVFHPAGDSTGTPGQSVLEIFNPDRVRTYGAISLSFGLSLAAFLYWALRDDEEVRPRDKFRQ